MPLLRTRGGTIDGVPLLLTGWVTHGADRGGIAPLRMHSAKVILGIQPVLRGHVLLALPQKCSAVSTAPPGGCQRCWGMQGRQMLLLGQGATAAWESVTAIAAPGVGPLPVLLPGVGGVTIGLLPGGGGMPSKKTEPNDVYVFCMICN